MSSNSDAARGPSAEPSRPAPAAQSAARRPDPDDEGRYSMGAKISVAVLVTYGILFLLILLLVAPKVAPGYEWAVILLLAVTALFLARYVSTWYRINDTHLVAWRLLGGRRVALEEVRAIEFASLRELSPFGAFHGFGEWGWRGRMDSPSIGEFDAIYTDPALGILVSAGPYPLYLTPRKPKEFARELSRRVRSYTGPLLKDAGYPGETPEATWKPSRGPGETWGPPPPPAQ